MINKPTALEADCLTHLNEEAAEVIKESCKAQRYGFDSCHPLDPARSNQVRIEDEIADFLGMVEILAELGCINKMRITSLVPWSITKKKNELKIKTE